MKGGRQNDCDNDDDDCDDDDDIDQTAEVMRTVRQTANSYPSFHLGLQPHVVEARRIVSQDGRERFGNPKSHKELFVLVVANKSVLDCLEGGEHGGGIGRL